MRSYRKWVLSLGLAAMTPGIALAGPLSPWSSSKTEQTAAPAGSQNQKAAENVAAELRTAKLNGFDIEVHVQEGVCVLEGKIGDESQKQAATKAASKAAGVKKVDNRLVVAGKSSIQQVSGQAAQGGVTSAAFFGAKKPAAGASDQQIAEKIAAAIGQSGVRGHDIDVKCANGVAILSGKVSDPRQVAQLTQVVSKVPGVQQVDNRLTAPGMRPAATPNQVVAERIAGALAQAGLASGDVEVRFNNGVATLRGVVGSPQQAGMAEQVVMQVPGVQEINNELQIGARRPGAPIQQVSYQGPGGAPTGAGGPMGMGGPMGPGGGMGPSMAMAGGGGGMPIHGGAGASHMAYDNPYLPPHAWPSYAAYPNYAAVQYPTQYSASAWPYIGPFYPYPQVPLGWRKVQLEWDDGYWNLNFNSRTDKWFWFLKPENWE